MIAEFHRVHKYCRVRFSEDARSARTIMVHCGTCCGYFIYNFHVLYTVNGICMPIFLCSLAFIMLRFLNTALLIGRSWDTRYFKFYLYFNATYMSLESKGSRPRKLDLAPSCIRNTSTSTAKSIHSRIFG